MELLIGVIRSYIDGLISLEKFEDWYIPKLEKLVNNPETIDIVAQLELGLAELNDEIITEEELKKDLRSIIE
jgi:hypothetical protein